MVSSITTVPPAHHCLFFSVFARSVVQLPQVQKDCAGAGMCLLSRPCLPVAVAVAVVAAVSFSVPPSVALKLKLPAGHRNVFNRDVGCMDTYAGA